MNTAMQSGSIYCILGCLYLSFWYILITACREFFGTYIESKNSVQFGSTHKDSSKPDVSPHLVLQHFRKAFHGMYSLNVLEINSKILL